MANDIIWQEQYDVVINVNGKKVPCTVYTIKDASRIPCDVAMGKTN